jgi:hypothetical protein
MPCAIYSGREDAVDSRMVPIARAPVLIDFALMSLVLALVLYGLTYVML